MKPPVQNIYHMLSYAFKVLREQGYRRVATEPFHNTAELCAAILARGISAQLRQGLGRAYITRTEALSAPRGKLEVTQSIKTRTLPKRQMVCTTDDFSVNSQGNRIIKTTVGLLLRADISRARKRELRKLMVYFGEVDTLDVHAIRWSLPHSRSNQTYQMLIAVCHLVVKGLLQTGVDGTAKLMDFLDERSMSRLYEAFILRYYVRHFPALSAQAPRIPWALDDGFRTMLPAMQSDVQLRRGNTVLIIDAKYYGRTTQVQYSKHTQHSHNLYQIFTYVKNRHYQFGEEPHRVSGMLLYAKTDEETQPDAVYQMHGSQIDVRTLDLNRPFAEIAAQLSQIATEYFEGVAAR